MNIDLNKKVYVPNPVHKQSRKRTKNLILGITLLCTSVLGLIILLILALTVLKDDLVADPTTNQLSVAGNMFYASIFFLVIIGIPGILFISGKFDRTTKPGNRLSELVESIYGIESCYRPIEGVNLDESNSLNLFSRKFIDFSDYLKGVTDKDVNFELSFLSSKYIDLNDEVKSKHLIEIKKYGVTDSKEAENIANSNKNNLSIDNKNLGVQSINGTMIIFRNLVDFYQGKYFQIKSKTMMEDYSFIEEIDKTDKQNNGIIDINNDGDSSVVFTDSRKEISKNYLINSLDSIDIISKFIDSNFLNSLKQLSSMYDKGFAIVYRENTLYVFINKYYINLIKLNEDKKLTRNEKDKLLVKSLESILNISQLFKLKGNYKSVYSSIYKTYRQIVASKNTEENNN